MKKQVQYFLGAIVFFTRIPFPKMIKYTTKSNPYFPLVGIVVGLISSLAYYLSSYIFSTEINILISMLCSIYITGAFHEDGFADVCDGFGGGWSSEKILQIMKDSRLGTYGTIGLIGILSFKFFLLKDLSNYSILYVIISGHSISRFIATILLYTHTYVRSDETSKVKPNTKQINTKGLILSGIFGVSPLFLFQNIRVFIILIPLFIGYWLMGRFFKKWIGGQTGDCAGALQQIAEIIFYLFLIIILKFM